MISSDFKGSRPLLIALMLFATVWIGWIATGLLAARVPAVCHFTGGEPSVVQGEQICSHVEGEP